MIFFRGVTGNKRFVHCFIDMKVNVSCIWRVRECGRKVKVIKARKLEKEEGPKESELRLRNTRCATNGRCRRCGRGIEEV